MLQFAIACLAIALIALVFDFRVLKARGAACWRESANLKPRGHRDEMGPDHGALATLDEQSAMDVGHEQPIAGDPAMNTQRYVGVVEHRNGRWVAVFALRSAPEMFELRTSPNWSKDNALACLDR